MSKISDFVIIADNSSLIILAVKSVRVAVPSSKDKPLAKEMSKSLTSKEFLFFSILLVYKSIACSNIISLTFPFAAKFPLKSNFCFEFFLIQVSTKQLPGPKSLLSKLNDPMGSLIIVALEIPPIFKMQVGKLILLLLLLIDEIMGLMELPLHHLEYHFL